MGKARLSTDTNTSPKKHKMRCGQCTGCVQANCGECKPCLDKSAFGGANVLKKACLHRHCENIVTDSPDKNTSIDVKQSTKKSATSKEPAKRRLSESQPSQKKLPVKKNASPLKSTKDLQTPTKQPSIVKTFTTPSMQDRRLTGIETPKTQSPKSGDKSQGQERTPDKKWSSRTAQPVTTTPTNTKLLTDESVKCNLCQKEFKSTVSLNGHMRVHGPKSQSQPGDVDMEAVLSESALTPPSKDVQLPKVTIDSMTKSELKEFIPHMLQLVTGREEVWHNRRSAKPDWWPDDVSWVNSKADWMSKQVWTDSLRSVVTNCYTYLGKEDLLHRSTMNTSPDIQSAKLHTDIYMDDDELPFKTGSYPSSPMKTRIFPKGLFFPFSAEIYICYFCEKEFLNKEKMRSHQKECTERPPELQKFASPALSVPSNPSKGPLTSSPKPPNWDSYPKETLDKFTGYLNLLPKQTAAKLRESRRSSEIDCSIIEDLEPMTPVTPLTPRTPNSLISQLSRDDSAQVSKKRLTYSLSMDKDRDKAELTIEETGSSDSESDVDETAVSRNKEMNLLNIPISSLLGKRIQKYVRVEAPVSVVDNSESFCRTPVKNSFLEKLRKKPPSYPIVYRPRRIANLPKENHSYKFTKNDVKEFMCRINTGLNPKSLEKVKLLKKMKIVVARLSMNSLLRWVPRCVLDRQFKKGDFRAVRETPYRGGSEKCEFPAGPTLLAKNIDKLLGLKKRSSKDAKNPLNSSLSLGNYVSEEMEAEVSKQKLTLYRSLLYEMSVLKPAVVMEDLNVSSKSDTGPAEKSKSVTASPVSSNLGPGPAGKSKTVTASPVSSNLGPRPRKSAELGTTRKNEVQVVSGKYAEPQREKSVFRKMCMRSKEERLSAEVEERERRKAHYRTLSALLQPANSASSAHDMATVSYTIGTNSFLTPKYEPSTSFGDVTPIVTHVGIGSSDKKSPHDDSLSVISLSSDGDSFYSGCCTGCKSKKQDFVSPCQCYCDSIEEENANLIGGTHNLLRNKTLYEPLSVTVVGDMTMPDCKTDVMYGIPSPVSIKSESPIPHTPTRSISEASTPLKGSQPSVSYESSGSPRRATRSLQSSLIAAEKHLSFDTVGTIAVPLSVSDNFAKVSVKSVSDTSAMSSPYKMSLLRHALRSRSLTPASSPSKMSTRSCSSLPSSPDKRKHMLVGSSKLHKSRSATFPSKMMLRAQGDRAVRTRSLSSSSNGSDRNPYSLKSGNFIVSSPQKNLTHQKNSVLKPVKSEMHPGSKSDACLSYSDKMMKAYDSPTRRSKRMSSLPMDGPPPIKLRKVYSDMAVQIR